MGLAMLAASAPWRPKRVEASASGPAETARPESAEAAGSGSAEATTSGTPEGVAERPERVAPLLGCVQAGLYGHLNGATSRVLEANGFNAVDVGAQDCCGALHAHGGDLETARSLARANIDAFEAAEVDLVAVNTAGCGAAMKEYGTLLEGDEAYRERAVAFAARVRDVTELLSEVGPREGAPVTCSVAYDHPCHLLHGQGVRQPPLDVLAAVPDLEVTVIDKADECCGGAGIYGVTHPDLGGRIGGDKVEAVRRAGADVACTPNPGCMMQIGAELRLRGDRRAVVHPVELLDLSDERAGYYG